MHYVKSLTSKPVVSVGRFTSPDTMVSQISRGIVDLIGAARPSIADPFMPRKIEQGRLEEAEAVYRADLGLDKTLSRACQHPGMRYALARQAGVG